MRYNRKSVVVTASTDSPAVSTAEIKDFLRIDTSHDDAVIEAYVKTATEAVKEYLRRAVLTETFVFRADGFADPGGDDRLAALGPGTHTGSLDAILGGTDTIDLPFPPLQSVTSVVTYDRGNNASTFAASNYQLDLQTGRIYLNEGVSWPSSLRAQNAVEITYVAGYGSGSIPEPILQAIRGYTENLYEGCAGFDDKIRTLLAPYRLPGDLAW